MPLGDDLNSEVQKILQEKWTTRHSRNVPEPEDLALRNDAVILNGTVLYADLDDSTELVNTQRPSFAAEIYKSYLVCAARIISSERGVITGYDGDRIMAVFVGNGKDSAAARVGLKINYAVGDIINPGIRSAYRDPRYSVKQQVGIDACELFVARTGIRGANDLVWVGGAANYAAKLSARNGPPTQITPAVYDRLDDGAKYGGQPRQNMWVSATAPGIGNGRIYTSTWKCQL